MDNYKVIPMECQILQYLCLFLNHAMCAALSYISNMPIFMHLWGRLKVHRISTLRAKMYRAFQSFLAEHFQYVLRVKTAKCVIGGIVKEFQRVINRIYCRRQSCIDSSEEHFEMKLWLECSRCHVTFWLLPHVNISDILYIMKYIWFPIFFLDNSLTMLPMMFIRRHNVVSFDRKICTSLYIGL